LNDSRRNWAGRKGSRAKANYYNKKGKDVCMAEVETGQAGKVALKDRKDRQQE
jgi:hypothetical protein